MKDYLVYTDASADIDASGYGENAVNFLPMNLTVGTNEVQYFGNDSEQKSKKFYDDIRNGAIVKTSQIAPQIFEEYFEPFVRQGTDILYLCLSSGLSATFQSVCEAAAHLSEKYTDARIYPVDSLVATGAMGIILERILANKQKGMSVLENFADAETFRHRAYANAYVDDLMHLKRGGRISATTAVFGKMLNIKPLIQLTPTGKLEQFAKCQGEHNAIRAMANTYHSHGNFDSETSVYICDADNKAAAQALAEHISKINPKAKIRFTPLSPVIGAHVGPEALVLAFEKKHAD